MRYDVNQRSGLKDPLLACAIASNLVIGLKPVTTWEAARLTYWYKELAKAKLKDDKTRLAKAQRGLARERGRVGLDASNRPRD